STATLSGRIVDENGPIEGVTVVAIHQPTNAQYYATTGRGGWWQLLDILPGGPYTLRIHYFSYKPLTIRNLYTYAGQNVVVDADLEAGTSRVHTDEAATSLRLGPGLDGGVVPVSPLGFDLVSQRIFTPVDFDVRRESSLDGLSRQWTVPSGSSRFHASAFGFFDSASAGLSHFPAHLGLTAATPLGSEDYQLFAGLEYSGLQGLSGAARFDGRINQDNRLEVSGGRLSGLSGSDTWAAAGFTSQLLDGRASNRAQALWYGTATARQLLVSDDYTLAAGRQRLLAGVQFAHQRFLPVDSAATRFDFYLQDAVRLGPRMTLQAGVRFCFPFSFSPRLSFYYDLLGTGALVLRAGTAIYGRAGEGSVWKNLAAVDTRLPLGFVLTLEGIYGQSWRKLLHISSRNVIDSRYALTARLERPLAQRFWAVAAYTRSNGQVTDRLLGGFSYRAEYLQRFATTASLLYTGFDYYGEDLLSSQYPAPMRRYWVNDLEVRLSQDLSFEAGGRLHTLQLTGSVRMASDLVPLSADPVLLDDPLHPYGPSAILIGLRYLL
ncbi:MAG: carboxypeptidase regulatory-like domain-containing protein, partial [Bacteroidales bacterium]|nr:carboxypeptidase regulatory-like domain-containing protein [Bacteroidales bacterium]